MHDVRVEWSEKLAPHPCADAASFYSFVLLQIRIRFCFGNVPKNPVRENLQFCFAAGNSDLFCFGNIPKNLVRVNGVESG